MHQIVVKYGSSRVEYTLPSTWKEVPEMAWWSLSVAILREDSPDARVWALRSLLFTKEEGKQMPWKIFRNLDPVQVKAMTDLLGWLWDGNMKEQPFASFMIDGNRYFLPDDGLKNVSLMEYAYIDTMYNLYTRKAEAGEQEEAEGYLNQLISLMCRPIDPEVDPDDAKTYQGDRRESFNTLICKRRLPLFKELAIETKLPILLFFVGCKREIHDLAMNSVFSASVTESGEKVHGSGRPMEPQEWIDICFHLSGGKFGSLDQTMKTNFFTILHWLNIREKYQNV